MLSDAIPTNHNRRRPLLIENSLDVGGFWMIDSISSDGKSVNCRNVSSRKWAVKARGTGLVICDPKHLPNDAKLPITIRFAPPLVFKARCTIYSIREVDTIQQCFQADVYCELCLRGISEIDSSEIIGELLGIYQVSQQMIQLMNGDGDLELWTGIRPTETIACTPSSSSASGQLYDYSFKFRSKGSFGEEFELHEFPFDVQDLSIVVSLLQSHEWVALEPNEEFPSTYIQSNFQLGNIYGIVFKDIVLVDIRQSSASESASGLIYPRVGFTVVLQRKPWYYVTNVAMPMMVITYLAFLSFAKTQDDTKVDVPDRLSITLTLLLTAVAYKFVVASLLPQVSYLTQLDQYISVCFAIMVVVASVNTLFPYLEARRGIDGNIEYFVVAALLGLFTLTNVIWTISTVRWIQKRNARNYQLFATESVKKIVAGMFLKEPSSVRMLLVQQVLRQLGTKCIITESVVRSLDAAQSELLKQLEAPESCKELVDKVMIAFKQ